MEYFLFHLNLKNMKIKNKGMENRIQRIKIKVLVIIKLCFI